MVDPTVVAPCCTSRGRRSENFSGQFGIDSQNFLARPKDLVQRDDVHQLLVAHRVLEVFHQDLQVRNVSGLDWGGLGWIGLDWIGLDWIAKCFVVSIP